MRLGSSHLCLVSSPDFIQCVYHFQYILKPIHTVFGFGSWTQTSLCCFNSKMNPGVGSHQTPVLPVTMYIPTSTLQCNCIRKTVCISLSDQKRGGRKGLRIVVSASLACTGQHGACVFQGWNKVLFCIWSCTKVGIIFTMMNRLSGGSYTYLPWQIMVCMFIVYIFGFAVLSNMIVITSMIYIPTTLASQ